MEILIAMALLSLSLSLIVRPQMQMIRHQSKLAQDLARLRAADLAMGEVRQLLFENRIPWKSLRHGDKRPVHEDRVLSPVQVGGCCFSAALHLQIDEMRTKPWSGKNPKRDWRLLKATIILTPEGGGFTSLHEYSLVAQRNTERSA
jgi:hypothetical protein